MYWNKPGALIALFFFGCGGGDGALPLPSEDLTRTQSGSGASSGTIADVDAGSSPDPDAGVPEIDQCPDASPEGHWPDLYNCYFGPTGIANCGSAAGCHDVANDDGTAGSGFLCGHSADDCWMGMNTSLLAGMLPIAEGPDGGFADPTTSTLWSALRKTSGQGQDNMPVAPATVVFSSPDMARIAAWIQRGAPND
jgi:hypothetical protein